MDKDNKIFGLNQDTFVILAVIVVVLLIGINWARKFFYSLNTKKTTTTTGTTPTKQIAPAGGGTPAGAGGGTTTTTAGTAEGKALQKALNSKGYGLVEDGIIGALTMSALNKEVQKLLGVTADGIFGNISSTAFRAKYNQEPTQANLIKVFLASLGSTATQVSNTTAVNQNFGIKTDSSFAGKTYKFIADVFPKQNPDDSSPTASGKYTAGERVKLTGRWSKDAKGEVWSEFLRTGISGGTAWIKDKFITPVTLSGAVLLK